MKPRVELKQIRDFGEIINDSILFFKQNFKPLLKAYFVICGFFWASGLIVSIFSQIQTFQRKEDGLSIFGPTYFLAIFFQVISYTMLMVTALSFITLYVEKGNEPPNVEEVWSYVKFYFLRVLSSQILLILGLIVATMCCFFPGVYFFPVHSLIFPIIIIENATLGYAFNRSFKLIKNNWWKTFGVSVVIYIIIVAAMIAFMIPVMLIVAVVVLIIKVNPSHIYLIVYGSAMHLMQFLYLLYTISVAFVYYSLTEQKDDGNLFNRIHMLGKNNSGSNQLSSEEEY